MEYRKKGKKPRLTQGDKYDYIKHKKLDNCNFLFRATDYTIISICSGIDLANNNIISEEVKWGYFG